MWLWYIIFFIIINANKRRRFYLFIGHDIRTFVSVYVCMFVCLTYKKDQYFIIYSSILYYTMSIERIGFSFLFISLILFFLMKYSDTRTVKFFEKLETHHIAFILLAIIIISNITILFFTQTTKIITVKEKYIRAGRYSTFRQIIPSVFHPLLAEETRLDIPPYYIFHFSYPYNLSIVPRLPCVQF